MKIQIVKIFSIAILVSSYFFAQEVDKLNNNCPPLFTHSKIRITAATIKGIEVIDSSKFTILPQFVLSLDSISKLIKGPEFAARAGVTGDVIIELNIDSDGDVSKAKIVIGIGAGCDEAALDVLRRSKFRPAIVKNNKVTSEIKVWVNFNWIEGIDKPDTIIDEIEYAEYSDLIENKKSFKLNKLGKTFYFESTNFEKVARNEGEIPLGLFTKVSDFIISQCFQNYNYNYKSSKNFPYDPVISIIVKIGSSEYYVAFRESDDIPVGLWALNKLLLSVKDQIKWEEVKE